MRPDLGDHPAAVGLGLAQHYSFNVAQGVRTTGHEHSDVRSFGTPPLALDLDGDREVAFHVVQRDPVLHVQRPGDPLANQLVALPSDWAARDEVNDLVVSEGFDRAHRNGLIDLRGRLDGTVVVMTDDKRWPRFPAVRHPAAPLLVRCPCPLSVRCCVPGPTEPGVPYSRSGQRRTNVVEPSDLADERTDHSLVGVSGPELPSAGLCRQLHMNVLQSGSCWQRGAGRSPVRLTPSTSHQP